MGPGTVLLERYRITRLRRRADGASVAEAIDRIAGGHARVVVVDGVGKLADDPAVLAQRMARYVIGAPALLRPEFAQLADGRLVVAFASDSERTLADAGSAERVGEVLVAVADALAVLHDQGIAHGLVLPELVEVGPRGVRVGGFGVAQILQAAGGPALAAHAVPAAYRAPELTGAMPARAETWTDAYALGVLACELLGCEVGEALLHEPSPRSLGATVSDAVEQHVASALSSKPGERPGDLGVWAGRLAKLVGLPAHAAPGERARAGGSSQPVASALPAAPNAALPTFADDRSERSELAAPQADGVSQSTGAREAAESAPPAAAGGAPKPGVEPSPAPAAGGAPKPGVEPTAPPTVDDAQHPGAKPGDAPAAGRVEPAGEASPVPDANGAPQTGAPPQAAAGPDREPAPPDVPAPLRDRPPPSRRGGRFPLLPLLGLVGGVLLMLGGLAAVFVFALERSASSTPAPTVGAAGAFGAAGSYGAPPVPFGAGGAPGAGGMGSLPAPGSSATPPGSPGSPPPAAIDAKASSPPPEAHQRAPIPVVPGLPVWGPHAAPVTIVVFGDLQGEHSRRAVDVLRRLKTTFRDELRLVWRHRPISVHPKARAAAELTASLDSPAFWKLAGRAAGQPQVSNFDELERWAEGLGSAPGARDPQRVTNDLVVAGQFDVRATPTFFVNGIRVEGNPGHAELARIVREEQRAARALLASGTSPDEVYPQRVRKNLIGLGEDVQTRSCPSVRGAPGRGAPEPLVTVVEFSEFQCPFCKRVQPTLQALVAAYPSDVRVVFKHFPLEHHHDARPAANLAIEAREQKGNGGFWQVHDFLFDAQGDLGEPRLMGIAQQAGLDQTAARAAISQRAHAAVIDADLAEGRRFGVRGTPSFFINGRRLDGAQPLSRFKSVVNDELVAARRLVAGGVARDDVYETVCGQ